MFHITQKPLKGTRGELFNTCCILWDLILITKTMIYRVKTYHRDAQIRLCTTVYFDI